MLSPFRRQKIYYVYPNMNGSKNNIRKFRLGNSTRETKIELIRRFG